MPEPAELARTMGGMATATRAALCSMVFVAVSAVAAPRPDSPELLAFKQHNPCPSSGQRAGACPGFEVDYVIPPCLGGPDREYNMQWLATVEYLEKARTDVKLCPATGASTTS